MPAVDGERVHAYFGSYGAVAYDFNRNGQWSGPMRSNSSRSAWRSDPQGSEAWAIAR